jgi:hypothetical protein
MALFTWVLGLFGWLLVLGLCFMHVLASALRYAVLRDIS